MNEIIRRAHEIRKEAAVKFGGKPGDYSLKIACEMAKNGEKVMSSKTISAKSDKGQDFEFEIADGKIVAATVISPTRGPLSIDKPCLGNVMLAGSVVVDGKEIKLLVRLTDKTAKAVNDEISASYHRRALPPSKEDMIPGLDALRGARGTRNYEHEMLTRAIDSGSSRCPAQTVTNAQVEALEAQYPAAVAYLRAESYACASNLDKHAAGRKAKELLLSGGSVEQANEIMDNWLPAYCD
jgi:hypothetical protein